MEFGVHMPQLSWGDDEPASLVILSDYVRLASDLGFTWLTANDHVVYGRPWLDGPVSLAAAIANAGAMTIGTSISLPVIRGPGPLAKAVAALDRLSGGRVVVGVGPGSSERDYQAAGIPWEERWPRFEEAVQALRALLRPGDAPYEGAFYSTEGIELLPGPVQAGGPPIWIGSWGTDAGLRRVARLADGWLASGYNTTPELFEDARQRLGGYLTTGGIDPGRLPNAIATMFMYVNEDRAVADDVIEGVLAPTLRRSAEQLRERLLVGPAAECAEKLARYEAVGAERIFVWPVRDVLEQLERFHTDVLVRLQGP